jgi:D-glycero-alpha-D-manno-heptose 1-phosphate guanylyltransferase
MMEAVILAGGAGTRLQQTVPGLPKPMAPVAGRPFLEYLLNLLVRNGFQHAVLSLGYMADKVTAHFSDRYRGMQLSFEVEDLPRGTGGAARQALSRCREDHAFIFNGDTYLDLEAPSIEARWQSRGWPIIVARSVADTERYGRLVLDGDRVVGIREKGVGGRGLVNAGCYVFPSNIFEGLPPSPAFSLETDYLTTALQRRRFEAFVSEGYFIDIGVPQDYARAQAEMAGMDP